MAPSPLYFMIKNPIKSFLSASITGGAVWYAYDYSRTADLMRYNCKRAQFYGDQKLKNPNAQVRHITVILNPVAGNRKAKTVYSKWVEPLLHLAGIKVSLIETQSLKQVHDLMKVMSNCDGVAIVGGDETVHEALNGLVCRQDCARVAKNLPIAIIPAGLHNSIARYIYQHHTDYRNRTEFAIKSTSQLVDAVTTKFDVLKIIPINREEPRDQAKATETIYALRDLRYGLYQDDYLKLTGISIYQNYIKPAWMKIQRTFRRDKYPVPSIEAISYTEPCSGCSRCYNKHRLIDSIPSGTDEKSTRRSWWGSLLTTSQPKYPAEEAEIKRQKEIAARDNPNCGKWIEWSSSEEVTDFRAATTGDGQIRLSIGKGREMKPSESFEVQDVRLRVLKELDDKAIEATQNEFIQKEADRDGPVSSEMSQDGTPAMDSAKSVKNEEETANNQKDVKGLLIDRKISPIRSLEVTTIREAITIFTGIPRQIVGDNPFAFGRK